MVKKILLVVVAILLLAVGGFVAWGLTPLGPAPEAQTALQSSADVSVTREGNWILFEPAESTGTGFIFYPGGRVDYRSYAPVLRKIAAEGYTVALVRMPLSLAVLSANRAADVIAAHAEIDTWAIGGHSLGGSMAASYADNHPEQIDGLVLWASYPAGSNDLSGDGIPVISITASEDGVLDQENLDATRPLLPADTQWVVIEGGNHAGFGSYGDQPGDNPAAITADEQASQAAKLTADFLGGLNHR